MSPATYGDVLDAESHISKIVDRGFTVSHRFTIAGRVVVEGEEVRGVGEIDGGSGASYEDGGSGPPDSRDHRRALRRLNRGEFVRA